MNSRPRSAALAAIVMFTTGLSTDAAVVVGLVLDPTTTAGVSADVNSIYSGLGTWHLFAVDDNDDDFGISSYNIDLTGATTIRHTSPTAIGIEGANGDLYEAGFNTLRSANGSTGSSYIHASQPLPDQSPFLIAGLGQQSGSFASVTGGASLGGATSSSWGTYNTISPLNGKNWLFLGEGTYTPGVLPSISQASFTVYNNSTMFSSKMSSTAIVPQPITPTLLTPEYLAQISAPPPPIVTNPINPPVVSQPVVPPTVVNPPPVSTPISNAPVQPIVPQPADQAVVVGMVVHPSSDGSGSPGTWQLFAVDNNASDFGISSYNVNISGAATVQHVSPSTRAILDNDGNPIDAGFNTLRGVEGANGSYSIHASQALPGLSPLLITGFGQQSGSFAAEEAARLGSTTLPAATSPDWGDYSTISPLNGNNWLLLAEGTYDTPAPPIISQATFTVYNDQTTFASKLSPVTVIPEPITPTLLTPEYFESLTPPPPSGPVEAPTGTETEPPPIIVPPPSPVNPLDPPTESSDPPAENPPPESEPSEPPIFVPPTYIENDLGTIEYTFRTFPIIGGLIDLVQPIDGEVTIFPYDGEYLYSGALQTAWTSEAHSLWGATIMEDGSAVRANIAAGMRFASYNFAETALSLSDQLSLDSAAETPEPCGLTLAALAVLSIATCRARAGRSATATPPPRR